MPSLTFPIKIYSKVSGNYGTGRLFFVPEIFEYLVELFNRLAKIPFVFGTDRPCTGSQGKGEGYDCRSLVFLNAAGDIKLEGNEHTDRRGKRDEQELIPFLEPVKAVKETTTSCN